MPACILRQRQELQQLLLARTLPPSGRPSEAPSREPQTANHTTTPTTSSSMLDATNQHSSHFQVSGALRCLDSCTNTHHTNRFNPMDNTTASGSSAAANGNRSNHSARSAATMDPSAVLQLCARLACTPEAWVLQHLPASLTHLQLDGCGELELRALSSLSHLVRVG